MSEEADCLADYAMCMIRSRHYATESMWQNLANALNRYNASKQGLMEIEESVIQKIRSRREDGRVKYGTTMERTDLSRKEWYVHAQGEAMDFVIYLEKLIREEKMNDEKIPIRSPVVHWWQACNINEPPSCGWGDIFSGVGDKHCSSDWNEVTCPLCLKEKIKYERQM